MVSFMVVYKQVEQTRVSKQEITMPFVKYSNIKAVRQYSIASPCGVCVSNAQSIAHTSKRGQYMTEIHYHASKAVSPYSHA